MDDALLKHLLALAFDFVFHKLRVAVWSNRHRCRVREMVDAVVQVSLWGKGSLVGLGHQHGELNHSMWRNTRHRQKETKPSRPTTYLHM